MPFARVNGQTLYYEDSDPDGDSTDVIVFSHGLFMDHEMFAPQVQALQDRWRCITWDERAHGATESTTAPFTYWDSANDVLGLLDHLGIERAVLAGMSQGGFLSLRAALTAPERVRALVLIDTQAGPENPDNLDAYNQLLETWIGADEVPQDILDFVAAIILGADWPGTAAWQDKWRRISPERLRQAWNTLVTREDLGPRMSELDLPAISMHGTDDAAIPVSDGQALADALGAELHLIEGAGHAANLTHPEPANAALVPFLDGL